MAFGGTPVVTQINDHEVRITGVDLANANTEGTIGLTGATGTPPDITLPATFRAAPYTYQGNPVALQDSIDVNINPTTHGPLTNLQPSVEKTGTAAADFRIGIFNTSASLTTQTLEIVVRFRPGRVAQPSVISP